MAITDMTVSTASTISAMVRALLMESPTVAPRVLMADCWASSVYCTLRTPSTSALIWAV